MHSVLKDDGLLDLAGDVTLSDLARNRNITLKGKETYVTDIKSATWFLPEVTHALRGGVRTVFIFAEQLSKRFGCLNNFVIYSHYPNTFDTDALSKSLVTHFPSLRFVLTRFVKGKDNTDDLPESQIAFCTLWTTAYLLVKYNSVLKKFYFMQDFEPSFYEAGSVYGAIEQTYRFGFSCIANTPGVGNKYLTYSDDVVSFYPGVDHAIFCPREFSGYPGRSVFRIVFYGRPNNSRNCFSFGIRTLKAVKSIMSEKVEILSVGAVWEPADFGLNGIVHNLGLLSSLQEVADLYRSSDIGCVFMATPHPSYQPLEYMACGCVTATNINEANSWLLNENNSLLLEMIPDIAARRICDLLNDNDRLSALRDAGLKTVDTLSWETAYSLFERALTGGQANNSSSKERVTGSA